MTTQTPPVTTIAAAAQPAGHDRDAPVGSNPRRAGRRLARTPLLWLGGVIVLAHLPYLANLADPNPLLVYSGIGMDVGRGLLPGSATIDPNAGFTSQALAHRAVLDWLHGRAPWWNPFEGLGAPLAGELQSAALFPLAVLLVFSNGQVYLYCILCLVAGYSTYFLLRRLALPPWACFAGGVAFGLNGTFAWFRFAPSNPVCFLPLLLLGVEVARSRARQGRRTHWWLVAVALGLSVLAGFPETAYLDGLLVLAWALVRLRGLEPAALRRYLGALGAGVAAGILLAAPLLVAFADYLPHASLGPNAQNLSHAYIPARGADLLLFPYAFGPIWSFSTGHIGSTVGNIWGVVGGYLTLALVLLAVVGLIHREHRALKVTLAAWSLVLVGASYGTTALANLLGLVPGLDHVLVARYMDPSVSLSVTVLAVFGLRDLLERRNPRRVVLWAAAPVAVSAVLAAWNAHQVSHVVHRIAVYDDLALVWGLGTLAALGVLVWSGSPRLRRVIAVGLLPLEAVVMFMVPELSAPVSGHPDTGLVDYLRAHIGLQRFATLGPLAPNYGSYYGIASLNENDLPLPKAFGTLVRRDLEPRGDPVLFTGSSAPPHAVRPGVAFARGVRFYEALGVRYLLVDTGTPPPHPRGVRLEPVYRDPLATVYALPRAATFYEDATQGCRVRPQGVSRVEVDCAQRSTLVRDELDMRGWTARVNGRPVPLGSTALYQQTVRLPPGQSNVSFSYQPPHIDAAWLAAAVGLAGCAVSAAGVGRRRRGRGVPAV